MNHDEETRAHNPAALKFAAMLTPEQAALLDQPKAWENTRRVMGFPLGATPFQMTGHFHTVCQIETPEHPITPSVTSRLQRLEFIKEEFLELLDACGCRLVLDIGDEGGPMVLDHDALRIDHIEGSRYDVIETADALGDLNVVVNGTGVEWGLPMHFVDYEVYTSNLSKVGPGGEVIRNGITPGYRNAEAMEEYDGSQYDETGYRPDAPVGKILKPDSFVKTNIPAAIMAYINKEI